VGGVYINELLRKRGDGCCATRRRRGFTLQQEGSGRESQLWEGKSYELGEKKKIDAGAPGAINTSCSMAFTDRNLHGKGVSLFSGKMWKIMTREKRRKEETQIMLRGVIASYDKKLVLWEKFRENHIINQSREDRIFAEEGIALRTEGRREKWRRNEWRVMKLQFREKAWNTGRKGTVHQRRRLTRSWGRNVPIFKE